MFIVDFVISKEGFTPDYIFNAVNKLKETVQEAQDGELILLAGRMPMWLTSALTAELLVSFANKKFSVSTYDPHKRLAIVTHSNGTYKIGDRIPVKKEANKYRQIILENRLD